MNNRPLSSFLVRSIELEKTGISESSTDRNEFYDISLTDRFGTLLVRKHGWILMLLSVRTPFVGTSRQ